MDIKKGKLNRDEELIKYYCTDDENRLILHMKDDLPVSSKRDQKTVKNKGKYNSQIACSIFNYLESYHIATHFVQVLNPVECLVKNLKMFPLEVKVWNMVSGSLQKRFGIEKGRPLNYPIVEFYLKNDSLKNPMITIDHACALGYAIPDDMQAIDRISRKTNAVLKSFFERRAYKLMDFSLVFGKFDDQIMIGDTLTADSFHISDISAENRPNNPVVPADDLEHAYEEIAQRLCS